MSDILKRLNRSDVYLTDYISKKNWTVESSDAQDLGIKLMTATSGSLPYYFSNADMYPYDPADPPYNPEDETQNIADYYNVRLLYESIRSRLYSSVTPAGVLTGSQDPYIQTSLTVPGARQLEEGVDFSVIKLPIDLVGVKITPNSLRIEFNDEVGEGLRTYLESEPDYWYDSSDSSGEEYTEVLETKAFIQDFEGTLLLSIKCRKQGEEEWYDDGKYGSIIIGDILYTEGLLVFTRRDFIEMISELGGFQYKQISWQSEKPIFTEHVTCQVKDVEFNKTWNPTASGSLQFGEKKFTPYITSIGLYNDSNDLLAVAKVSKPIKKAGDIDMTFDIQIDLG